MPRTNLPWMVVSLAVAATACSHVAATRSGPTVVARRWGHSVALRSRSSAPPGFRRMTIGGLSPTAAGSALVLVDEDRRRALVLSVGDQRALASALCLGNDRSEAPAALVRKIGGDVTSVSVTQFEDDGFRASVQINRNGKPLDVETSPSEAISLAVGDGVPVFVAETVLAEAGIDVEKFDFRHLERSARPGTPRTEDEVAL